MEDDKNVYSVMPKLVIHQALGGYMKKNFFTTNSKKAEDIVDRLKKFMTNNESSENIVCAIVVENDKLVFTYLEKEA